MAERRSAVLRRYALIPLVLAVACTAASLPLAGPSAPGRPPPCTKPGRSGSSSSVESSPASRDPMLAVTWDRKTDTDALVSLDPVTLERRSKLFSLGEQGLHWYAFSPDGSQVAVASRWATIRFFDVTHGLRFLRKIRTSSALAAFIWPSPDVLVGVLQRGGPPHDSGVLEVDARTGRALQRTPLSGTLVDAKSTSGGDLVGLLTPNVDAARIGAARIVHVSSGGEVETATLDQIEAGFEIREGRVGVQKTPGLALDAEGEHAFVVGKGSPVADIRLDTMEVAYHSPAPERSLLSALAGTLTSSAWAKGSVGPYRWATRVGDHMIAVTGYDSRYGSGDFPATVSVGIELVDTDSWAACTFSEDADDISVDDRGFYTFRSSATRARGSVGLTAYDFGGHRRWHLFGLRAVGVQAATGLLYVRHGWDTVRQAVVDPATGRILHDEEFFLTQIVTPGPLSFPTGY